MEAIKGHTMRAVVLFVAKLWELTNMTRTRLSECEGSEPENNEVGVLNLKVCQRHFNETPVICA
jgi:hypothetical protein